VTKKVVEYLAARSRLEGPWEFMQAAVPGKFVGEAERAGLDLRLDASEVYARAAGWPRWDSRRALDGNVVGQC